jgi:hypothetical protein
VSAGSPITESNLSLHVPAQVAADLYWNSPFGRVCRWRAERYFLSYWLLFGEDLPDPGRERRGLLVLRHSEDACMDGDAAGVPTGGRGVGAGALSGRVLGVKDRHAGLDPFLSGPVCIPLGHQWPDFRMCLPRPVAEIAGKRLGGYTCACLTQPNYAS